MTCIQRWLDWSLSFSVFLPDGHHKQQNLTSTLKQSLPGAGDEKSVIGALRGLCCFGQLQT